MKAYWKIPVLSLLVILLILVRQFEYSLFPDPFMEFYKTGTFGDEEISTTRLYLNVALRYIINSMISLAILYVVYLNRNIVRFSGVLFVVLFAVLFPLYIYFMGTIEQEDYLAAFYVRRFLVQPIMLLLLLPAFYYQRLNQRSEA